MAISDRISDIPSDRSVRDYDGWILLGYAAIAVLAIAAIYLAALRPGEAGNDLMAMAAMP